MFSYPVPKPFRHSPFPHIRFATFLLFFTTIHLHSRLSRLSPCCVCHALVPPSGPHPVTSTSKKVTRVRGNIVAPVSNSLSHHEESSRAPFPRGGGGDHENSQGLNTKTDLNKLNNFINLNKINKLNKTIQSSLSNQITTLQKGYQQRLAADPSFLTKSLLEITLAATTQTMAEVSRRGWGRMVPEFDFVFAGVLTAVCGKYYSMWRVAKTVDIVDSKREGDSIDRTNSGTKNAPKRKDPSSQFRWMDPDKIPTNAFQPTLLDGITPPTLPSRLWAFILPMPQLFRAGVLASIIGYGFTSILIQLRSLVLPWLGWGYKPPTQPVSVPLAAIYTGVFMALVSNVRYQVLQGIVEPVLIDGFFYRVGRIRMGRLGRVGEWKVWRQWKGLVIVGVRWGNGLLGSWIAIGGMRALGLQKLKE